MDVQQHMNTDVKTCTTEETVASAVLIMARHDIGALIVVTDGNPVGIFTERDLLKRVVAEGRDPAGTLVGDVMSCVLVTVDAEESVGVAYHIMFRKNIRHMPVVKDGRLAGIVSMKDLNRLIDGRFFKTYFNKRDRT